MVKALQRPLAFEWDNANKDKNFTKHGVTNEECEEVFFDENKRLLRDTLHSGTEKRYIIIGRTVEKRLLFVVFTIRRRKIRVISARDLNRKEAKLYEKGS